MSTSTLSLADRINQFNLLGRLKVGQKLLVAAFITILMLIYLVSRVLGNLSDTRELANSELVGAEYIATMNQVMEKLPEHRNLWGLYLTFFQGDESVQQRIMHLSGEIDKAYASLATVDKEYGEQLGSTGQFSEFRQAWDNLKSQVSMLDAAQSFDAHSALAKKGLDFTYFIAGQSRLLLEPEADAYSLMNLSVTKIPQLAEAVGQARDLSTTLIAEGSISDTQIGLLAAYRGKLSLNEIRLEMFQLDKSPDIKRKLDVHLSQLDTQLAPFTALLDKMLAKDLNGVNGNALVENGTQVLSVLKQFSATSQDELTQLLRAKVARVGSESAQVVLVIVIGFSLVLLVGLMTATGIITPLKRAIQVLSMIAQDRFDNQVQVNSKDELGQLLYALDDMQRKLCRSVTETRKTAAEALRIKQGLDVCQTNVMLVNGSGEIVYMNESVQQMLVNREYELKDVLPRLDVNRLLGENLNVFSQRAGEGLLPDFEHKYHTEMEFGELTFDITATPVRDDDNELIGVAIEWDDKTERLAAERTEREIAAINHRIKQGLDVCKTNVMLVNAEAKLVYMNSSMEQMLAHRQAELSGVLPGFNISNLIGDDLDCFCIPGQQVHLIPDLKENYHAELEYGPLTFDLSATPVKGEDRELIGVVIEWDDQTEVLAAQRKEREIAAVNLRIKQGLDVCKTNVMLADANLSLVYLNNSLEQMFRDREQVLRQEWKGFSTKELKDKNVEAYYPGLRNELDRRPGQPCTKRLEPNGLTFDLTATDIRNDAGELIGVVIEWVDMTEVLAQQLREQQIAAENLRIRQGLDVCQTNVMLADADMNIVYMNEAVTQMLSGHEATLSRLLPSFKVSELVGTCVDVFHQNPAHQRGIIADLQQPYSTRLPLEDLTFDLTATPIRDKNGEMIGVAVEWVDMTQTLARQEEERRQADENLRIRQALDNVSTNTMVADGENNIVYMNESLVGMMSNAEKDIRKDLPQFEAAKLMGQNMDSFHKNPAHQQGMINNLASTYKTQIGIGGRTFSLTANPINNAEGQRIGTVVEWMDRTEEVAIELEVDDLINSAALGDLTQRIETQGKEGFFLILAEGLNKLVGIAEGVIDETVSLLDGMSHGLLTNKIETEYEGAFDKLKQDANATIDKLTEVIGKINESATSVNAGANEISQGNADLSQRTEEQASSLEETASSMEEMTSTVKQNADNAKIANDLAVEARGKAQQGGEVVSRAVSSMEEINDASKKIADIIGVIDEIAFQTNLLALNAAVEAARAGEQGRGFAVVAGEVRNLAQRSAEAAKEIKELIRDSVNKVEDGSALVNESGETLKEIVSSVEKVSQMVADISVASDEQSSGIEQVNKAISQMDEMTQQNAALVEQASAAGESMAEQASSMKSLLGFFTVDASQARSVPKAAKSVAAKKPVSSPAKTSAPKKPKKKQEPAPQASGFDFAEADEEWQEF